MTQSADIAFYVGHAAAALFLSAVATPAVTLLARRLGVVDRPGGRHLHRSTTPQLGGIAVALSFGVTLSASMALSSDLPGQLLGGGMGLFLIAVAALMVLVLGVVDDVHDLSPIVKLLFETLAATIVVFAGYGFVAVSNPISGGTVDLGWAGPLATVAWIVLITNAFNLIDGLDGLAAGVALIATLTLTGIAAIEGRFDAVLVWAVLAGSLLGFMPYNLPPASIFLGDSGSLLLGFAMAVLSIQSLQKGATTVVLAVPVLALGLPLSDTAHAVLRRWLGAGVAAIARPDRDHVHHRLLRLGFSERRALLILYSICLVFSVLAFLAVVARGPFGALLVAFAAMATLGATRWLESRAQSPDEFRRRKA